VDEQPAHKAMIAAFFIDAAEVTVAEYKKCVEAGACAKPLNKDDNKNCNWGYGDRDAHPVNCVGWAHANAYCTWAGKRLPTEAEWEKASRGAAGAEYPWGATKADCGLAVISQGGEGCGKGMTWPVCSKAPGNSPFGLCDTVGNVWEWVADWYAPDYYGKSPAADPAGPATGVERVLKGGAWTSELAESVRSSVRLHFPPATALGNFGFRCAQNVPAK
jgi:formylglycine-generating enzyme required for sulfatase activity